MKRKARALLLAEVNPNLWHGAALPVEVRNRMIMREMGAQGDGSEGQHLHGVASGAGA